MPWQRLNSAMAGQWIPPRNWPKFRSMQIAAPFPSPGRLTSIYLVLAAVSAAYLAIHSFLIASTETSSLPIADIYDFYRLFYFKYLDSSFSFWRLFDRHNEHLILTTRLPLFVDTIWFHASGKFVLIIAYLLVVGTAVMLASLAATPSKWEVAGLAIAFLGLGCARIQLDNLTRPFHVSFLFVHAFALITLIALWRGLAGKRSWYLVAFICDFGTVFSLGTGVLLGISAVGLALWARRFDRLFGLFLLFHSALIVVFVCIHLIPPRTGFSPPPTVAEATIYFLTFLGNFVAAWPNWAIKIGSILATIWTGLISWLTWRSLRYKARHDEHVVVLSAFALFVILEAITAAWCRAKYGIAQALSERYTTCTLLLVSALFALAWRIFPQRFARITTLVTFSGVLLAANNIIFQDRWWARNRQMDAIADEIAKGSVPPGATQFLYVDPDLFASVIWRFRDLRLGPFWERDRAQR